VSLELFSLPNVFVLAAITFVALVGLRLAHNWHAAFLFSLSAPGAVCIPILAAALFRFSGPILPLMIFPAAWILPPICCFQLSRLRKTARKIDAITCIGAGMVIGLYFATFVMIEFVRQFLRFLP
jgi:hypothetical protein